MRDARGRIMLGDPSYGRICECGNLKGKQAVLCRRCYIESTRDADYWQRRTCECGGPKTRGRERCRKCANAWLTGRPIAGREQAPEHPWRARAIYSTST